MNKLKLAAGIILVLLVGALAGSLVSGIYHKKRLERFTSRGPPPHLRKVFVKRLSEKLDLTGEQRTEIEKIVKESQVKIFAIRRKYLPEIREISDQSFALIEEKLNSEQKKELWALYEKLKYRHIKAFIQSIQIEETAKQALSKMKERLNLTQEQVRKAQPIIEESIKERRKTIQKFREKDRPDFFSVRQELRKLQDSMEQRLSQILTGEQMTEYRKAQEELRLRVRPEKRRRKMGDLIK